MKKTFIMLVFAAAASMASAENSVTVQRAVINPGSADFVYINLNNETPCAGVSYEMHLPKGITFYNEATVAQTTGSSRVAYYSDEEFDNVTCLNQIQKSIFTDTDGHQYGIVASAGGYDVLGNSGQLFRCRLQVASDMEPGVYPIVFKDLFYADATATQQINLKDRTYTSYIVIGNPTNAELALKGEVGSEINTALVTEAAVKTLDLSAVTASYGTFTYVDGREVVAPTADFAATAAYSKTVSKYASLTMPFAADLSDKGAYVLDYVDGTTAFFNEATTVNAGDVVLLTQEVNLVGNKIGAATKSVQPEAYYVAPDGQSLHKGTNVTVPALRGYWNLGGGASNLRIALDGVLTDINMVDVQGEGADAFDLQGRRTANAKNGVFVVNGKKQFVK